MTMKRIWDSRDAERISYCPPVLSNGSLYTLLDYHGDQPQVVHYTYHGEKGSPVQMTPGMHRAGRRWNNKEHGLITYGHFEEKGEDGPWKLLHAVQTLDLGGGIAGCENEYADALTVKTTAFVHKECSLFAVRKEFSRGTGYDFSYFFTELGPENRSVRWSDFSIRRLSANSAEIRYEQEGAALFHGTITVIVSCDAEIILGKNEIRFHFPSVPPCVDFFMLYTDDMEGNDFEKEQEELIARVRSQGFDGLLAEQRAAWGKFWGTFELEFADRHMQDVFYTALYALECSATDWGIPVGIHPYCWNGLYFGFNLFSALFLATGHTKEGYLIPAFRRKTLDAARARVTNWSYSAGIRYPWMSDEKGIYECASPGVWIDHIFHMGHICTEAWETFRYTRDMDFLKETAYPVLSGCAEFYLKQAVYRVAGGKTIIGKFCDLERLGTARENVFLTTCSAITSFDKAAKAADLLGVDADKAALWRKTAGELKAGLADDGEKYIAFPDCPEATIGIVGGLYPYSALAPDDPKQRAAILDFAEKSSAGGNMYPVGKTICSWYAAWIGCALRRAGEMEKAAEFQRRATETAGAFDVMFEINEPGAFVSHPWCSEPPSNYLDGMIELFLYEYDGVLRVAEKIPEAWYDFHFRLHAPDDLTVSCTTENGRITQLEVAAGSRYSGTVRRLLAEGKMTELDLSPGATRKFR